MIKTLIQLTLFSLLLALLNYALQESGMDHILHPYNYWMLGFFWLTYILIHFASVFLKDSLQIDFSLVWLGAVTARLLIALFSFLIVAMTIKDNLMIFAANFSALYLSFLVFEIITVLSTLRRNSRLDRKND